MAAYRLDLLFRGVERSESNLDLLETIPDVHWTFQSGVTRATATVSVDGSAVAAARWLIGRVVELIPTARPDSVDRELVAVPDIASRLGVNRETVRAWSNNARRSLSPFPRPESVVGDGIRVWRWAVVNEWAQSNLRLGDSYIWPTAVELAAIEMQIARWADLNAWLSTTSETHVLQSGAMTVTTIATALSSKGNQGFKMKPPEQEQFALAS